MPAVRRAEATRASVFSRPDETYRARWLPHHRPRRRILARRLASARARRPRPSRAVNVVKSRVFTPRTITATLVSEHVQLTSGRRSSPRRFSSPRQSPRCPPFARARVVRRRRPRDIHRARQKPHRRRGFRGRVREKAGPAWDGGVRLNDKILSIDGARAADAGGLAAVADALRGPAGSTVELVIKRGGRGGGVETRTVVRALVTPSERSCFLSSCARV